MKLNSIESLQLELKHENGALSNDCQNYLTSLDTAQEDKKLIDGAWIYLKINCLGGFTTPYRQIYYAEI